MPDVAACAVVPGEVRRDGRRRSHSWQGQRAQGDETSGGDALIGGGQPACRPIQVEEPQSGSETLRRVRNLLADPGSLASESAGMSMHWFPQRVQGVLPGIGVWLALAAESRPPSGPLSELASPFGSATALLTGRQWRS